MTTSTPCLQSGYTILFGSNPQEAADLAAISYKVSATSLIPVANAMDGFATSHMMCETLMPEPALLREFLGDPSGRIKCPTVAQEMLFGAKGRVFQLKQYITRHQADLDPANLLAVKSYLDANADAVEKDNAGELVAKTLDWFPEELRGPVAAAMAQRVREGHPPAGSGAGRHQQSRHHRRRAEPARLPGWLG